MKCQRLILEVGDGTFTLDLHPRLTVIAGLGRAERESLISELFGALAGTRSGVHLQIRDGHGGAYAVLRPAGERHQVVDLLASTDVTHRFTGPGGTVDLLARSGLSESEARERLRIGAADLADGGDLDDDVRKLAHVDQKALWATAEHVLRTGRALGMEAEAFAHGAPAEVVAVIDHHHARLERALERDDRERVRAVRVGAAAAVAAVPLFVVRPILALPPLMVTTAAQGWAVWCRTGIGRAARAEDRVLAEVGVSSYLGFQLRWVDGMLAGADARRRVAAAAELHSEARAAWRKLVGPIDVQWAMARRDDIASAALLEQEIGRLDRHAPAFESLRAVLGSNVARSLVRRLADARRLGPTGESLPMVLDDPFADVDPGTLPALLTLLARTSGHPQVILLTEDPSVRSWARLEAMTGDVAILEAGAAAVTAPPIDLSDRPG